MFYWPTKGNVEVVAKEIEKHFEGGIDLVDLSKAYAEDLEQYDFLILGCSTFGADAWKDATNDNKWYLMFHDIEQKKTDFKGKKIAMFGLGDQVRYPYHFVDALKKIYDEFSKHNVTFIGEWPNEGYEFYESKSLIDNKFLGLALDLDNQSERLAEQVKTWAENLKKEFI